MKNLIAKAKKVRGRKPPCPGSRENSPYWKGWDAAIAGESPLSNSNFSGKDSDAWLDGYHDAIHQMDLYLEDNI